MRVDLHIHTAERSGCASSPALDQLAAARRGGLQAIAITDHHRMATAAEREVWHDLFPDLLILPGIEITIDEDFEDILVIGSDHPDLVRHTWSWRDLHAFGREQGALMILAHPYRFGDDVMIDCETYRPDAVEIHSTNITPRNHARILDLADALDLPVVSNSDAHSSAPIGKYANRLAQSAATTAEVTAAIREGRFAVEVLDPYA